MGAEDQILAARTEMCARIDTMARAMMHLSPDRLADELDAATSETFAAAISVRLG